MSVPLRARVKNGRLVLDAPTDLPEGTEVELYRADDDELDEVDRERLHRALDLAREQVARGEVVQASAVLDELRRIR